MYNKYISNEVIAFQLNSSFAKQLVSLFQEILDYRHTLMELPPNIRITNVHKYYQDSFCPRLIKLIKKETNIILSFISIPTNQSEITLNACIYLGANKQEYGDPSEVEKIGVGVSTTIYDPIIINNLKNLSDTLNKKTGKLSVTNIKKNIYCALHLDVNGFINTQDFISKELFEDPFTAEELTSIVLHEIGHVISFYELASKTHKKIYMLDKYITSIFNNQIEEKNISSIANTLKELPMEDTDKKEIVIACNKIEKLQAELIGSSTIKIPFRQLFRGIIFILRYIYFYIFINFIRSLFFSKTIQVNEFNKLFENKRLNEINSILNNSDLRIVKDDFYMIEQLADEYVVRHGLTKASASCMEKITKISSIVKTMSPNDKLSGLNYLYIKYVNTFLNNIGNTKTYICFDKHKNELERIRAIIINAMKIFRNTNLPIEIRNSYISECEDSLLTLKKLENRINSNKLLYFIKNKMFPFMTKLLPNNFNDNYEILMQEMTRLADNDLFYHAARLEQLMDDIKK